MSRLAAPCLALAVLLAPPGAGAITKCTDKAGKVTYQDGKCPDDARAGTVYVPPPPAPARPAAAPGAPPPGPPPQDDAALAAVEETLALWEYCATLDAGLGARHLRAYDGWKGVNQGLYRNASSDGDARDRVKAAVQRLRDADRDAQPPNRPERIGYCDAALPALLSRDINANLGRKK